MVKGLRAPLHDVHHGAGAVLVGLDRLGLLSLDLGHLGVVERQLHALAQLEDDLVLQAEDVADGAIDLHGARDRAGRDCNESGSDPDQVSEALIATGHQPHGAQLSTHFDHHPFVGGVAGVRA